MNSDTVQRPERTTGSAARVMMPGEAPPPMDGPSPAGEPVLLGGGSAESDQSERTRDVPLGPLAVLLGYPFSYFGKSVSEEADEAVQERERERQSASSPQTTTTNTLDRREQDRLDRENARLREQLRQAPSLTAQPPDSTPPIPQVTAERGTARSSALREELAALERNLERRTASGSSYAAPTGASTPGIDPSAASGARQSHDRDRDGRPDRWVEGEPGQPVRELLDQNGDGRADLVHTYDAERRLARTEEDLDFDGRYEVVTQYRDGERLRRHEDSDGDGQIDRWSYFEAGALARVETDRDGDGFRDVVATYIRGELDLQEEDRNGDGQPDRLERFRAGETIEVHEDVDLDGQLDVASYYEKGKLVRRELRSTEILNRWEARERGPAPKQDASEASSESAEEAR